MKGGTKVEVITRSVYRRLQRARIEKLHRKSSEDGEKVGKV